MPISKARVQDFLERICVRHGEPPPKLGSAAPKNCRRAMKVMRVGKPIKRDVLAHELAHWLHGRHLRRTRGASAPNHGKAFQVWQRYAQNLVAEEFGSTEGVSL